MKNVTPAEVGEQMLRNEDPETPLTSLIELMIEKGVAGESSKLDNSGVNEKPTRKTLEDRENRDANNLG
ncbi:hypothetical protein L6164_035542 [Bauhinia variegata]|uniref:Uncharacterized protein n=1 Tax=Bauhinia variegata TaxID=167791 RepID=A0ACB9KED9_BAUVA|nr:hypothetical protein L6164_035542 [Bauhinia variegata]